MQDRYGAARARYLMAWSSAAVISSSAGNPATTAATRRARDLARSYASFLAAVRAKTGQSVPGWPPDAQERRGRPPIWSTRRQPGMSPCRHGGVRQHGGENHEYTRHGPR